jgi:hypothetical protein
VFAGLQRVDSGALAPSAATCSVGVPFGSFAPTGGGGLNRVFLYDTAGGTRVFYLALPDGYDKPGAPARTLLLALHGGASYGDLFSAGARALAPMAACSMRANAPCARISPQRHR